VSCADQSEKWKIEHSLLLFQWPIAWVFGLEEKVYEFNLSSVICVYVRCNAVVFNQEPAVSFQGGVSPYTLYSVESLIKTFTNKCTFCNLFNVKWAWNKVQLLKWDVLENHCSKTRAVFVNKWDLLIVSPEWFSARTIWKKWIAYSYTNTMVRGPMQLHRLKAGPDWRHYLVLLQWKDGRLYCTICSPNHLPLLVLPDSHQRWVQLCSWLCLLQHIAKNQQAPLNDHFFSDWMVMDLLSAIQCIAVWQRSSNVQASAYKFVNNMSKFVILQ